MNKVYKVKRNKFGQSVVTSELAKNHSVSAIVKASLLGLSLMSMASNAYAQRPDIIWNDPITTGKIFNYTETNTNTSTVANVGELVQAFGSYTLNSSIVLNAVDTNATYGIMLFHPIGMNDGTTDNPLTSYVTLTKNSSITINGGEGNSYGVYVRTRNGGNLQATTISVAADDISVTGKSSVSGVNLTTGAHGDYKIDIDNVNTNISATRVAGTTSNIISNVTGINLESDYSSPSQSFSTIKNVDSITAINNGNDNARVTGIRLFTYGQALAPMSINIENANLIYVKQNDTSNRGGIGIQARNAKGDIEINVAKDSGMQVGKIEVISQNGQNLIVGGMAANLWESSAGISGVSFNGNVSINSNVNEINVTGGVGIFARASNNAASVIANGKIITTSGTNVNAGNRYGIVTYSSGIAGSTLIDYTGSNSSNVDISTGGKESHALHSYSNTGAVATINVTNASINAGGINSDGINATYIGNVASKADVKILGSSSINASGYGVSISHNNIGTSVDLLNQGKITGARGGVYIDTFGDTSFVNQGTITGDVTVLNGKQNTLNFEAGSKVIGNVLLGGDGNDVTIAGSIGNLTSTSEGKQSITIKGAGASYGNLSVSANSNTALVFDGVNYSSSDQVENISTVEVINGSTFTLNGTDFVLLNGTNKNSVTVDSDSKLNLNALSGFDHALLGSGDVSITNGADFTFGTPVAGGFNGNLTIGAGTTFTLSGNNTGIASGATLITRDGSTITIGESEQEVGNLTLNGGTLTFNNSGSIITNKLSSESTTNIELDVGSVDGSVNLLDQMVGAKMQLIEATDSSDLTKNHLNLVNASTEATNINQDGSVVAKGKYSYELEKNAKGIGAMYSLSELDIQANKTLALTTKDATNRNVTAKLMGSGNLALTSDATGMTLTNQNNNYTGTTKVTAGTVKAGSNNAFGQTSGLVIDSGATVNLNDKTQTIGQLTNNGTFDFGTTGSLAITKGGTSSGELKGKGSLNISGGELAISNSSNEKLGANITINKDAALTLNTGAGLGNGNIALTGDLNIKTNTTLGNKLSGTGSLNVLSGEVVIAQDNANFKGNVEVKGSGALTIESNNQALGTAKINLDGELTQFKIDQITSNGQINNAISGNGTISINTNSDVTLAANNKNFSGKINNGGTLNVSNQEQLGASTIANMGNLVLNNYNDNAEASFITNTITGVGTIGLTRSNILLKDNNNLSKHSGVIQLNAASNLTVTNSAQLNSGSSIDLTADTANLNIKSTGAFTLVNRIDGSGNINVNTGGQAFNFGSGVGSAFKGNVNLGNAILDIKGDNTTALTNATLVTGEGSKVNISDVQQNIGNLSLNGGTLVFGLANTGGERFGSINTGVLTSSAKNSTKIQLDLGSLTKAPGKDFEEGGVFDPASNLLNHSGTNQETLIFGNNTKEFNVEHLVLENIQDGTPVKDSAYKTEIMGSDLSNSNIVVADAIYNYRLAATDDNDLAIGYGLTELSIRENQTLVLSATNATKRTMEAQITDQGTGGNLGLRSDATGIKLKNSTNNYKGATTVESGLVIAGSDNAFGQTSKLNISSGATVDLNGKTQSIGKLDNQGTLNLKNGSLTLKNGGQSTAENGLLGGGTLDVVGGNLTLSNSNSNLEAKINITNDATVNVSGVQALGKGGVAISQDAVLNLGSASDVTNAFSGAGSINVKEQSVGLSGDNSEFTGQLNIIGEAKLTITNQAALGSATVNVEQSGTETLLASQLILSGVKGESGSTANITNKIIGGGDIEILGNSNVSITGKNNTFNGAIYVSDNSLLNISQDGRLGTGSIDIVSNSKVNLTGFKGTLSNTIIGDGTVDLSSKTNFTLGSSISQLTGTLNIGADSIANITANNQLNSALTGTGILNVNTSGQNFNFSDKTKGEFAGTVNLGNTKLDLKGDNTTALGKATLVTGESSVVSVSDKNQEVGNVTLGDGGTLSFTGEGSINTDTLTTNGKSDILVDVSSIGQSGSGSANLLDASEGTQHQLITAQDSSGVNLGDLTLKDSNGEAIGKGTVISVEQDNVKVAEGTYNYGLKNDKGLSVDHSLTQLNIIEDKTLSLESKTSTSNTMGTQLVGKGNLTIASGSKGFILNNEKNSYTGTTTITEGTVTAGSDNAFGQTSSLNINAGTGVDLSDKTQTVGSLVNNGTLSLDGGSLTLKNGGSSTAKDGLTGKGTITVAGGDFKVSNTNDDLSATVNITKDASSTLVNTGNLGSGAVNLDGALNLNGNNSVNNAIAGSGSINTGSGVNATLTGDNSGFKGSHNINGGSLTVSSQNNLGTGSVNFKDSASNLNVNSSIDGIQNSLVGQGNVNLNGSKVSLTGNNSNFTGSFNVDGTSQLTVNNGSQLGKGSVAISQGGDLNFNNYGSKTAASELNNTVSGQGNFNLSNSNVSLSANNQNLKDLSGNVNLSSGSNLTISQQGQLNSGLTVNVTGKSDSLTVKTDGAFNLSNTITGSGALNVDTNGKAFDFGANVADDFKGTVNLGNSTLDISGNNTAALKDATLSLGKGSIADVTAKNQSIGGLEFNGGTLSVVDNVLTVTEVNVVPQLTSRDENGLTMAAGNVQTDISNLPSDEVVEKLNILDKENLTGVKELVTVTDNKGKVTNLGHLDLIDDQGNQITSSEGRTISQNGQAVADATYDYKIVGILNPDGTTTIGLGVGYGLVEVKIKDGADFEIDTGSSTGNDLDANITGGGNLVINTDNDNGLNINNSNNDFDGDVVIKNGTVKSNVDNGLGNGNGNLIIKDDGTLDLQGNDQAANNVTNDGNLNINGGDLNAKGDLNNDGDLSLGENGNLVVGGDINNKSDGVIDLGKGGVITGNGDLNNENIIDMGTDGEINIAGNVNNKAGGELNFGDNGQMNVGKDLNNDGAIDMGNNGNLEVAGDINNKSTGTIDLGKGGVITGNGDLNNENIIDMGTDGEITIAGDVNNKAGGELNFGDNGKMDVGQDLNNDGAIDMGNNGNLEVAGDINNKSDGTIDLGTGGVIVGQGDLNNENIIEMGTDGEITIAGNVNNKAGGELNFGDNGQMNVGQDLNNDGAIDMGNNGNLEVAGDINNKSTGTIDLGEGGVIAGQGDLNNENIIEMGTDGEITIAGNVNNKAGGELNFGDNGQMNVGQDLNNDGAIDMGNNGNLEVAGDINNKSTGTIDLGKGGVITGNGDLNNENIIDMGTDGEITIAGDVNNKAGGELNFGDNGKMDVGQDLNNDGAIDMGNNGNLEVAGDINNKSTGTIDLGKGGVVVGQGDLNNENIIEMGTDGEITIAGNVNNKAGGELNFGDNGKMNVGQDLNNDGAIDMGNNGNLEVAGDINNKSTGTIDLGKGGVIAGQGDLNNENIIEMGTDGEITIAGSVNNKAGGELNFGDNGQMNVGKDLNNDGAIDMGNNGNLEVAGDINNNATGTIDLGDNGKLGANGKIENKGLLKGDGVIDGIFNNYGTVEVSNKADGSNGSITFDKGLNNYKDIYISNTSSKTAGNKVVVNGNYTGHADSAVYMNVDLGSDTTSRVDQMIITGHAGGSTVLHLNDLGNVTAALTSQLGVKLIDVGTSDAKAFKLSSAFLKGAYEYTLHRNDADQDWYMTSYGSGSQSPDMRPDVGNIFGNVGSIIGSQVPGYGGSATLGGMPGGLGGLSSLDRLMTEDGRYLGSVWSSNTAAKNKGRALDGQVHFSSNTYSTVLGADTGVTSGQNLWIVGGMLGLGSTDTDSTNRLGTKTKSDVSSTTFGLYGTWYFDYQDVLSPYLGFSTTYSKFDNTIKRSGVSNYSYDSHAWVTTLNGGYPFMIDSNLVLEPQGQLSYVNYKSKNYQDNAGTNIKESISGNMIYRAGLFVYPKDGDFKPFAGVNIWYDSIRTKAAYDGVALKSDKVGFSYEAKVGFNYQATKNFSISTEFNYQQGKSHKRDYNANIGLKYQF